MSLNDINLSKLENDELLEIYNRTEDYIEFLENEIKSNEVEKK